MNEELLDCSNDEDWDEDVPQPLNPASLLSLQPLRDSREYLLENHSSEYRQAEEKFYEEVRPLVFIPHFKEFIGVYPDGTYDLDLTWDGLNEKVGERKCFRMRIGDDVVPCNLMSLSPS
eukprot:Phypoly_transcript_25049.p1 GENE.Phypoly_transcript_25049~~Phypoly_transcript_25049.p1  ORF type:complete len:137 (+),score=15.88 Phypoly_transcript_25049:55-411(+)